ncbi:MAG: GIY-YIG nuclease family protein [candidate division SR1 bacterium]|nr:MAG: GIY-YIG nuclease family protein [candidate division SR1 bacterium]
MEVKGRVYILLLGNGQYYVGSTNDLERRTAQHKAGKVIATKGKLPLKLIYTREYETLSEARSAEYHLKQKKSRKYIEIFMKS